MVGEGRVTANFGGVDVVTLLGAIAGCHCSVPGEGRVTTKLWGVDVVPLLGASVLWLGGGVMIRRSGRALLSTIAGCQSLFHIFVLFSGPPISPRQPRQQ